VASKTTALISKEIHRIQ